MDEKKMEERKRTEEKRLITETGGQATAKVHARNRASPDADAAETPRIWDRRAWDWIDAAPPHECVPGYWSGTLQGGHAGHENGRLADQPNKIITKQPARKAFTAMSIGYFLVRFGFKTWRQSTCQPLMSDKLRHCLNLPNKVVSMRLHVHRPSTAHSFPSHC